MSAALTRANNEIKSLRLSNLRKNAVQRLKSREALVMGSSVAGALSAAAGCAVVDAKLGKEGEPAEFGDSGIPICASIGALVLVGGAMLGKKHPEAGAFLFQGGLYSVGSWVNRGIYNKMVSD